MEYSKERENEANETKTKPKSKTARSYKIRAAILTTLEIMARPNNFFAQKEANNKSVETEQEKEPAAEIAELEKQLREREREVAKLQKRVVELECSENVVHESKRGKTAGDGRVLRSQSEGQVNGDEKKKAVVKRLLNEAIDVILG